MTAIFYGDCFAISDNGRFTLQARSPHNGTINHRDGRKVSQDEFGFKYKEHQSEFRYQLFDETKKGLLWERWQKPYEDSPHELVVSDDGWTAIRTHGFKPEMIFVNPKGEDVLSVAIRGAGSEHDRPGEQSSWIPKYLSFTTAGLYWSSHSWRYFLNIKKEPYFVWRASWGQRLVVDLAHSRVLIEESLPASLEAELTHAEKRGVTSLLTRLFARIDMVRLLLTKKSETRTNAEESLLEQIRLATGALALVGFHRIRECLDYLREWESIDYASHSTGTSSLESKWWCEHQYFRPIIHNSLKVLGEEPQGFATYYFTTNVGDNTQSRFLMPERLKDRSERMKRLNSKMVPEDVLYLLGSPDFIRRDSRQEGRIYKWWEIWEYDCRIDGVWVTNRITWEEDSSGSIRSIENVAPYWLTSDERENEYLRW